MGNLKKAAIFLSFMLLLTVAIPAAQSKSYSYDYVKFDLYFQQNGSVYVKQERDYNFQGSYSYAYIDFLKKGSDGIKILNVADLDSKKLVDFHVSENLDSVTVTWYYSADYQAKRFLIEYFIQTPVKKYEDVSEFYWKLTDKPIEKIDNLDVNIHLPSASSDLFKIFMHSSASPGKIEFSNQYTDAFVNMKNIPSNTFVELRLLTSPQVFPEVQQINEKKYENILSDERGNLIIYGAYGFFSSIFFVAILALAPLIIFLILYMKYGREPRVEYDTVYEHEPPHDIPPMALSNLMEGEEMAGDIKREALGLLGTLFDLAVRGYLEIRERKEKKLLGLYESTEQVFILTKKGMKAQERSKLEYFEQLVLDFVFSCGSKPNEVTSSEISKYCKSNYSKVKVKIDDIDKFSRHWFERNYFKITDEKSSKMNKMFTYISTAFIIIYFIISYTHIMPFVLIFLGVLVICVILSTTNAISRRTPESALEMKRWKAFKKFISDFSAMKDAPASLLHIWDKYLVYAITLGVAKKLLENIKKLSLERNVPIAAVAWYNAGVPSAKGVMDVKAMSSFIDNLSNTVNALSSSTSVGGGFSGGGGGGGGGGGSGAG